MTLRARLYGPARLALMLGLRYFPVPWPVKRRLIWQLQPKVVVAADAIIPDGQGRVLLLRTRYSGHWQLPGGALNRGEDPLSAVIRECREELGLEVTVERLVGVYADPPAGLILFGFRCRPLAGVPRLSEEHDAYRYGPPEQAVPPLNVLARDGLADGELRVVRVRD